jgi:hypothetical protein
MLNKNFQSSALFSQPRNLAPPCGPCDRGCHSSLRWPGFAEIVLGWLALGLGYHKQAELKLPLAEYLSASLLPCAAHAVR